MPSRGGEFRVVIIGAGFAGLNAAKALEGRRGVRVLLLDRRNHHLFQPLLYQVATAGLNPADIAAPVRAQFSGSPNVEVRMGEVRSVDLERRVVRLDAAEHPYDALIVACGATHSYFGHAEWERHAPGLKTLENAIEIRRRILTAFEEAENEEDLARQRALLTFVVVGAGPTGVELAGAIADIARTVLVRDFTRIDPASARVLLLEGGPRALPAFHESLGRRAERDLAHLGVEVRLGSQVTRVDGYGVQLGDMYIPARTVLWAAGVQAERLGFKPAVELDRAGRVKVGDDFSLPGHPEVFVVGDMASFDLGGGRTLPGQAPAAKQAGQHVAAQILRGLAGRPRTPFRYLDKGAMATIGKYHAVLQSAGVRMAGPAAWLAWLLVHVAYLVGFKNKFSVMLHWVWSYLFSRRGARLITGVEMRSTKA